MTIILLLTSTTSIRVVSYKRWCQSTLIGSSLFTSTLFHTPSNMYTTHNIMQVSSVLADDEDTSRSSKSFELCMSKCMYSNTRPPPVGSNSNRLEPSKDRNEIRYDCKAKCATSKEQLLTGKPKVKMAKQEEAAVQKE
jgi:hypothetical protein